MVQTEPLSAGVRPGRVPRGNAPPALGSVSMETIQEMNEILIFGDIDGKVA